MRKRLSYLLATCLGAAAVMFVTTACWLYGHRPEVPEELLK